MTHDVVVIGGGISGLSCAQELAENGLDVQVLERQVTTGGNAKSLRFDKFLMELGPTTLNAAFPNAMKRIDHLKLGQTTQELGENVRKRYLRDDRGLHGISTHPLGFFTSGYLSIRDRLSIATELFRPTKSNDNEETIHQFATRRFGVGFADKVIDPMAAGIFMGDSKSLSINGSFPKLVELEKRFGSITRGILAAKRGSEPGRMLLSWDDGIATLPQRLTSLLADRINTGVTVTKITRTSAGFKIETANSGTINSRAVVLAVQPHVASALLGDLAPETAAATGDIAAPAIGVVYFGYHKDQVDHQLDGLGFLSVKAKDQVISGAQFCSTMFSGRAPSDHVSISCYVGGARNPELANMPETELVNMVHRELSDLLGIRGEPVLSHCHRWPRGLPSYTLGHDARRQVIETTNQRVPGLFLTGNYLQGVSMTNCLEASSVTAGRVVKALKLTPAKTVPREQQLGA